jgi:hypothetical protein
MMVVQPPVIELVGLMRSTAWQSTARLDSSVALDERPPTSHTANTRIIDISTSVINSDVQTSNNAGTHLEIGLHVL